MTTEHDTLEQRLARRERGGSHTKGPVTGLAPRSAGRDERRHDLIALMVGDNDAKYRAEIGNKLHAHLDTQPPVVDVDALAGEIVATVVEMAQEHPGTEIARVIADELRRAHLAPAPGVVEALGALKEMLLWHAGGRDCKCDHCILARTVTNSQAQGAE